MFPYNQPWWNNLWRNVGQAARSWGSTLNPVRYLGLSSRPTSNYVRYQPRSYAPVQYQGRTPYTPRAPVTPTPRQVTTPTAGGGRPVDYEQARYFQRSAGYPGTYGGPWRPPQYTGPYYQAAPRGTPRAPGMPAAAAGPRGYVGAYPHYQQPVPQPVPRPQVEGTPSAGGSGFPAGWFPQQYIGKFFPYGNPYMQSPYVNNPNEQYGMFAPEPAGGGYGGGWGGYRGGGGRGGKPKSPGVISYISPEERVWQRATNIPSSPDIPGWLYQLVTWQI